MKRPDLAYLRARKNICYQTGEQTHTDTMIIIQYCSGDVRAIMLRILKEQAAHTWSPSVCVSVSGVGKKNLWEKLLQKFRVKISKSQPPSMGQIGDNREKVIYNE